MKSLREMTDSELHASARQFIRSVRENPKTEKDLEEADELERRLNRDGEMNGLLRQLARSERSLRIATIIAAACAALWFLTAIANLLAYLK